MILLENINYKIRENKRSKHVNIRISRRNGVVITIPEGFSRKKIPDILAKKRSWIENTVNSDKYYITDEAKKLPEKILLHALEEEWNIEYRPTLSKKVEVVEQLNDLTDYETLVVFGNVEDKNKCFKALGKWINYRASNELPDFLDLVSNETNLEYNSVAIRNQKARWGSCSSSKTISLNQKLLFLPYDYMKYILIHELCHTKHMNHSDKFWKLVEKYDPEYKEKSLITKEKGWSEYVPYWADYTSLDDVFEKEDG